MRKQNFAVTLFPYSEDRRSPITLGPAKYASRALEGMFLVPRQSALECFVGSLSVVLARAKQAKSRGSTYPFRSVNVLPTRLRGGALSASLLLHCFLVGLFLASPVTPKTGAEQYTAAEIPQKVYYYKVTIVPANRVRRIVPSGPGGHPAERGSLVGKLRPRGSTVSASQITIVSKPPHPSNSRQTIYQPLSPPNLVISKELRLPDIVPGTGELPPVPSEYYLQNPKPVPQRTQADEQAEPAPPSISTTAPMISLDSRNFQPQSPAVLMPIGPLAAPRSPGSNQPDRVSGGPAAAGGLLVVGVDPAAVGPEVSLPGGNRWGEFTIAGADAEPDAPKGGNPAVTNSGRGGSGSGGDESTGVGTAKRGGGESFGPSSMVSVRNRGNRESIPELGIVAIGVASKVFPVISTEPRRPATIISAGPMGGGGLDDYGILHCSEIYTIFVPMPGKNWTLQYCRAAQRATVNAQGTMIHLEPALIPPDPEQKFDFQRVPVPPEKAGKMIVLKGVLKEDGSVENVQIQQSVMPEMDEAARIAFSRWSFKPALLNGKPVRVQLLVGIPLGSDPAQ